MLDLLKRINAQRKARDDYKRKLLAAFPKSLKSDVEAVLAILPLDNHSIQLGDGSFHTVNDLISLSGYTVQLSDEPLTIPYRLYFNGPDATQEAELSGTQKTILNCIYLRHSNGYIRQKRLENLIDAHEYCVTPFTLQLLGEYIYEILEVLAKHTDDQLTLGNYKQFIDENPEHWRLTKCRMVSYWNEYYRGRFPVLERYVGQSIVYKITNLRGRGAPLRGLTQYENAVIFRCLKACLDETFFPDWEFSILTGFAKADVMHLISVWPSRETLSADDRLLIANVLNQLVGYPHGVSETDWHKTIGASKDELQRLSLMVRSGPV